MAARAQRTAAALSVWPVAVLAAGRKVARIETQIMRARLIDNQFAIRALKIRLGAALAELEAVKAKVMAGEGLADGSGRAEHRGARP